MRQFNAMYYVQNKTQSQTPCFISSKILKNIWEKLKRNPISLYPIRKSEIPCPVVAFTTTEQMR